MKTWILSLSLLFAVVLQAQEFKPYKIKSGKITYEKLKYSTVSGYSNKNGVETSYSKQVPYVAEQIIYYWDEFGDIAFEEVYQVSKFGGKLLPEKVKLSEELWIDEDRYYFEIKNNDLSKNPYHLRTKCKENFQYYQIKDSWVETLYMGTDKSGTKELLGKEADYYRIDKYQDLYTWKGLVLKKESFATTPKGERLHIDRARVAIEIDVVSKVNKELFNPIWLKREAFYNSLDGNEVGGVIDARPDATEQADNVNGIEIQENDIFLFVTSKLVMGKMQILSIDKNKQLTIKYSLYNYTDLIDWRDSFRIKNNSVVNIDSPHVENATPEDLDFKWSFTDKAILFPQNNLSLLLVKASRTKALKIKEYKRKN